MVTSSQTQLRFSLSPQMGDILARKASEMGVPVTQFVKFLIFKAVEQEQAQYTLTQRSEDKITEALSNIDSADVTEDINSYLNDL